MTRAALAASPDDDFGCLTSAVDHLASGDDPRLALDIATRLNRYGCSILPRLVDGCFSSSTASSISPRALSRVEAALTAWEGAAAKRGAWPSLDQGMQDLREEFCDILGLCVADVDIVFSPSGTDAQLHAIGVVKALMGGPLVTVVAAADETGSGTRFAASGRHFLDRTAQGRDVEQSVLVEGMDGVEPAVLVPANGPSGPRSIAAIDEAVIATVAAAHQAGRKVVVQAMNASKLGRRCPSDACLDLIRRRWNWTAQIVVDACQMRIGAARLRHHLDRGDIVLVTGSKFFTGPAFSGALLIPSRLRVRPKADGILPKGLADYASRQDWPSHHRAIRDALPRRIVLGHWLRWEAAMAELSAYAAVPPDFRKLALRRFEEAAEGLIRAGCRRPAGLAEGSGDCNIDEEFAVPTIFPFLVAAGTGWITPARAAAIHRDLNRDMASALPRVADAEAQDLAACLCHIGQPVPLASELGATAALRVSADARFVVECWSPDTARARRRIEGRLATLRLTFDKLELLQSELDHAGSATAYEKVARP